MIEAPRSRRRRAGALLALALLFGSPAIWVPRRGRASAGHGDAARAIDDGQHGGAGGLTDREAATPEPLSPQEEADPSAGALARRFNPAMALPDSGGPWPVAVGYTWSAGADLMSRTTTRDGKTIGEAVARHSADLARTSWADLPRQDALGHFIQYWIDAPGDDRLEADGRTGWRRRWRQLAGDDPSRSAFPPTQYAHLFWVDRAHGRLAIQYWFFFPFNEWINHHEGDWEHINVVLEGPARLARSDAAAFRAVEYQFFFHGWRLEPAQIWKSAGAGAAPIANPSQGGAPASRIGGAADHPVVFTGGRGHFLGWSGTQSGGSYPWPARYEGAGGGFGPWRADDDTRRPARFVPPEQFEVVLLPEPARLDAEAHPELSWLRLPFFAGQPRMYINPPLLDRLGAGKPPLQPGLRADWNSATAHPLWTGAAQLDPEPPSILPSARYVLR